VCARPVAAPFLVDLDDRTVVLKFSAPGRSVLAEAWAYDAAAAQGIRVPRVLAVRPDPELVAVEFLAGVSLWSGGRRDKENSFAWRVTDQCAQPSYSTSVRREDRQKLS
jgi:hypothetical protein